MGLKKAVDATPEPADSRQQDLFNNSANKNPRFREVQIGLAPIENEDKEHDRMKAQREDKPVAREVPNRELNLDEGISEISHN